MVKSRRRASCSGVPNWGAGVGGQQCVGGMRWCGREEAEIVWGGKEPGRQDRSPRAAVLQAAQAAGSQGPPRVPQGTAVACETAGWGGSSLPSLQPPAASRAPGLPGLTVMVGMRECCAYSSDRRLTRSIQMPRTCAPRCVQAGCGTRWPDVHARLPPRTASTPAVVQLTRAAHTPSCVPFPGASTDRGCS
jgi:hypothetical protein